MDEQRLLRKTHCAYVHGGEIRPDGSLLDECDASVTFDELARIARDRKKWRKRVNTLS